MANVTTQMRVLAAAVNANVPVILWGSPGIGKSAVIEGMFEGNGYHVAPVIASHRDPSDFNGLPIVVDGKVQFAPPRWATEVNAADKAVVFLDEFSQASPATQGSCLRMLQERWVGETKLHDNVSFILAANPPESAAGGFDLAAPTSNRLLHLDWQGANAEDWAQGLANGWDVITPDFDNIGITEPSEDRKAIRASLVSAFIMRNPSALEALPDDPAAAGKAWASRRSWDNLAKVLAYIADDDHDAMLTAAIGCVGEGLGTEFAVFIQNADLPDPREVLESEGKDYDFSDPRLDRHFVVLTGVSTLAASDGTRESWDKAWGVLSAAAESDRADLAVGGALRLMKAAQTGWVPPAAKIKAFVPILQASGLISEVAPKKATAKKAA